jgi:tetratricopeptide (TPR) repeat protein
MRPRAARRRTGLAAAFLAAAVLSRAVPARAMTPEDELLINRGEDMLYRCDYDGAEDLFRSALKQEPHDPVLSLGLAVSTWWRMENDFALPGTPEEKQFFAAVKGAIADAKAARDGASPAEAWLYLGAAYGLRGRREASLHHWLSAYFDGRRAYKDAQRALTLDPELYDAYLGIGAFDYYVATLGRFVRALSFARGGSREQGLAELDLAARKSRFSRVAAKLLIVGIDWTFEKKPDNAWSILDGLHKAYPDSPLIDSMRLIGLFHLKEGAMLEKEARADLEKARKGADFYRPVDIAGAHYFLGVGLQMQGRSAEALREYREGLRWAPEGHRLRSLLWLAVGEGQDLVGRREEAEDSYRQSLREPPLWGVARYARFRLKHPFRPGDNPLPARNQALD